MLIVLPNCLWLNNWSKATSMISQRGRFLMSSIDAKLCGINRKYHANSLFV